MTAHPLLDVDEIPATEPYLRTVGQVFRSFREQDSGCLSHGVRLPDGTRWFVKEATTDRGRRSLDRAWSFHRTVRHPALGPPPGDPPAPAPDHRGRPPYGRRHAVARRRDPLRRHRPRPLPRPAPRPR